MTTPYMTGKRMPLKATFVVSILRSPDMSKVIRRAPIAPRGGDIYVYSIENNVHREAWKNDNIHFHHDGTRGQPKANPIVRKIFFCAMMGDGRWTRDFMKHVYTLYHNPNNFVVIHYLGDESIARDVPRHRKPRSNTKKSTTCTSTSVQVDTSELCPSNCSQDDDQMIEDVGHEDDDEDDYSGLVELGEPTVEIDCIEDDSGIVQSQMLITYNDYHSEGNTSAASTSTEVPFTSTPNEGSNIIEPIPFACLDMMPMSNPLGLLSEVTLSCQPLEPSTSQFNPNEASTSYASFSTFSGGGAGSLSVNTPREPEPSSVIPKKRLAMRLEGQDTDIPGDMMSSSQPSLQPMLPKKRRLDFTDSPPPMPGPSSATDNEMYQAPGDEDDAGDANDSGQPVNPEPSDRSLETLPSNTVVVSDLASPSSRSSSTSTPRLRLSIRQGFQDSISSLVQNVQNLQSFLGDPAMWESSRETRDTATDPEHSRPTMDEFIQNLVSSGQIALIVAKVMQLASSWKQRPGAFKSRSNPCMTLINQIRAAWSEDMEAARTRLMTVLGKNPVAECDVKNYYHLVTACVVGAYRMQVPLIMLLTTLSTWPQHLEECDTRTEVEVEENIQCVVGRTLLSGTQLKTLEKMDQVDAQVIRAYLQLLAKYWTSCLSHYCFIMPGGLQQLWEQGDYTRGMLDKETLTDYTWIMMPYQASDTHWVLLIANVQERTVSVVNTARHQHPDISVEIVDHWRKYMKFRSNHTGQNLTRWKMEDIPMLQQTDQTSSGVHIMMAAESILCGASPVIMRSCHVRRYRQYALSKLLSEANFDIDDIPPNQITNDDLDLHAEDNLPDEDDGSPQTVDRSTSLSCAGVASAMISPASAVPSCSEVTVSSDRRTIPAYESVPRDGRKRSHSSSDIGDQEEAIDFSRSQSAVSCEDGQPRSSDDSRSVNDQSLSQFGASHPREHNYANRRLGSQTVTATARAQPAHEDPKCSASRNASKTVPNVPGFQVTGFLFQPGSFIPSHQPPMYPGRIDNPFPTSSPFLNISTPGVQEKPCDMSMQSQLALDSQPSTSSQFSYHQDDSVVEDLRVNITSTYRASPEPPRYIVSETAGATYTELSNVRLSDLQPSIRISSSQHQIESFDMKSVDRRNAPSPSSASDSSEMINVESLSPHQATEDGMSGFGQPLASMPKPSSSNMATTSSRCSASATYRVNNNRPSDVGLSSTASGQDEKETETLSDSDESVDSASEDNNRNVNGDLSNLDMLSTVAAKDAS